MKTVVIRVDAHGNPFASFEGTDKEYILIPMEWEELPLIFHVFLTKEQQ